MIDALLTILTGGATGLLGAALSFITDFLTSRQRHLQELALRRLDMEMARVEAASVAHAAAIAAEDARDAAAWRAVEASHRHAGRRWSRGDSAWLVTVDVVRGLLRPVLTVGFIALVGVIYFNLGASEMEILDIRPRIIDTVLYLATTCVLWWFGARAVDKRRRVTLAAAGAAP